jgi:hypothetical protein
MPDRDKSTPSIEVRDPIPLPIALIQHQLQQVAYEIIGLDYRLASLQAHPGQAPRSLERQGPQYPPRRDLVRYRAGSEGLDQLSGRTADLGILGPRELPRGAAARYPHAGSHDQHRRKGWTAKDI